MNLSSTGSAPNELKLTSELLLPPNHNGDVVFIRDYVDSGAWNSSLDAVAALHRDQLITAAVEDGDVTVHVVTDMVKISFYLAPRSEDNVV